MGIRDNIRARREARRQAGGHVGYVSDIAAEVYEDGDTAAKLGEKIKAAIEEDPSNRPIRDWIVNTLLPLLLPFLIKLLSGLAGVFLLCLLPSLVSAGECRKTELPRPHLVQKAKIVKAVVKAKIKSADIGCHRPRIRHH